MKNKMIRLAGIMCVSLTLLSGCSGGGGTAQDAGEQSAATQDEQVDTEEEEAAQTEEAEPEEEEDTGDASLDNPRNEDGIGEKEILVTSFGTSFNDSRRLTIGAIEDDIEKSEPDYAIRRAFTSQIIIDHVKDRDGEEIDNVKEALDRAASNEVKTLVVVPTHLMDGFEYNDLKDELAEYSDAFETVVLGKPLLASDEDFTKVAQAMIDATKEFDDGETAICFMGHGTEADSNGVYEKMQQEMDKLGAKNVYIGTVEATPSLDDVLKKVQSGDYKRVVLRPMMVVAGDHANNDMAGDDEDSWKSVFEAAGYEVECVLEGLGQLPDIRAIYVEHTKEAIESQGQSGEQQANGEVASAEEMAEVIDVVDENAVPVPGSQIKDGDYAIDADSSSPMFRIEECSIHVENDNILATMTMGGTGYRYVYPGTGEEALTADESDFIPFVETAEGKHTFTVPVEALNAGVPLAAFSDKKEKWYDRTLVFKSGKLPTEAYEEGVLKTGESLHLANTAYQVGVVLSGGSGKATVTSPTRLRVQDGACTAEIEWSSPHYDYMIVEGDKYLPINEEGNSVFEIPVAAFDIPLAVVADTTAMSEPHEIEYTLLFDAGTLQPVER